MPITAIHTLVYSDDATATRAFFKDVLRWPFVTDEPGPDGSPSTDPAAWLIFATGRGEMGVHPTETEHEGRRHNSPRHHEIAVLCDDLDATITELSGRGAEFGGDARDMGFGRGVMLRVPGADDMLLYQPHHTVAFDRA